MGASMVERAIGAARLDPAVYEDVEKDPTALGQAMAVVALAALCSGIGAAQGGVGMILLGVVGALVGWFIWAAIIFVVGTMILPEPSTDADLGQVLRCIGFAAAPGILMAAGFIPLLGAIIALVATIWQLAATVVAVRQALDYTSTGRAVGVCVLGFLAYIIATIAVLTPLMVASNAS
ncbi:MAG: YIP1 family protein [bacterium]|nr:YIP1 family protein [bacterium]